ncbi:MAG: phage holin family protein [Bacteroidales bacterium]|nr:phage holin family protein [Bacteroidales bacterium]
MKKKQDQTYPWKFASVGGTVRVKIQSGEDIRHLGELDRKMWTVLSCPTQGLEFDAKTLKYIDVDGDGRIRVDEVIKTAQWLTRIVKDANSILEGRDVLEFSAINEEDADGARLLSSARQILKNLGLEKESVSAEDTADFTKIFAGTLFNGDGIITPASAGEDEALAKLIETIAGISSAIDRSGVPGVTADQIEAFYAACADFKAWKEAGTKEVFPFGDKTADALAAVEALKDKVADYFMRCKLIGFDEATSPVLDVNVDKIAAIEGNLAAAQDQIGAQPLAKPAKDGKLKLDAVNPAWKAAVDAMKELVGAPKTLDEAAWNDILAKFGPYTAWLAAKKGGEVEGLGLDAVSAILKEDKKAALLELIEKDKAEEANALSIEEVGKLVSLYKNFYRFLNNYVVLADFYDPEKKAIFQAGRLYIDQRSTDLCVKVAGPAPEISSLSGMYILYCACTSEKLGKSFNIAAVLTDGDVDGLREGKNAVFYDREGNDYTAKVIAIVDNPISIRQAFWAPYKKVARMINDRIDKKAAEKNEKSMAGLTAATNTAADGKAPAAPFDIAKYAGIFAAVGMAVGLIGAALAGVIAALKGITWWQALIIIAVVLLLISGPSMFIAWRKLRKRDLGPVLNANGWAINAKALVNVKFGKTLTSLAKFPKLTAVDEQARKAQRRRRFWTCFCCVVVIAVLVLWLFNFLAPKCPSPLKCYKPAPVEEVAPETEAEAEPEAALEEAAPEAPEQ